MTKTIRALAEPVASRPSATRMKTFYAALGCFAANWAMMELALDLLVPLMKRVAQNHPRKPLPHQLGDKIKHVRNAVKTCPEISLAAPDLCGTLDAIERLSKRRHDLIHGAALSAARMKGRGVSVVLMRFLQPPKQNSPPVTMTTAEIERTAREVDAITDRLLDMAEAINAARF